MSQEELERLAHDAVRCRVCFSKFSVRPARIDLAQPRWIGPRYRNAARRIAVVLLNPGSGAFRSDSADERSGRLLREFEAGTETLEAVFRHQADDMKNWGRRRFEPFYFGALGLVRDEIALANIAWCSTQGNQYPQAMLEKCFGLHTGRLLTLLEPDVVILSGVAAGRFSPKVQECVPAAQIVSTLHYAHRLGREAEKAATDEAREAISRAAKRPRS